MSSRLHQQLIQNLPVPWAKYFGAVCAVVRPFPRPAARCPNRHRPNILRQSTSQPVETPSSISVQASLSRRPPEAQRNRSNSSISGTSGNSIPLDQNSSFHLQLQGASLQEPPRPDRTRWAAQSLQDPSSPFPLFSRTGLLSCTSSPVRLLPNRHDRNGTHSLRVWFQERGAHRPPVHTLPPGYYG